MNAEDHADFAAVRGPSPVLTVEEEVATMSPHVSFEVRVYLSCSRLQAVPRFFDLFANLVR